MPGDGVNEKDVIFDGTGSNVVDDLRALSSWHELIRDDANVWEIPRKSPGNEVTREIVLRTPTDRNGCAFALEERLQVWHSPMIDVAIRLPQLPCRGVDLEVTSHVFVD